MSTTEFLLLSLSSLFVIMDPIGLIPVFLAMTPKDTLAERARTAKLASTLAATVLIGFALLGKWAFKLLGITLPAFQMAGCVVILLIALDMLRAERSTVRETKAETDAGRDKDDIAITPLGVPMLAGPGAISTIVLLQSRATSWEQQLCLHLAIVTVCFANYLVLRWSAREAKRLSPLVMKVVQRLMGLLLAAIAFQFMINAIETLGKSH
jgi:multiple antibiotic resistance protein